MKYKVLMKHKRGWLEGTLEQVADHAIITNPNGNKLYDGSATFLDALFAKGYLKLDEGRENALSKLFEGVAP